MAKILDSILDYTKITFKLGLSTFYSFKLYLSNATFTIPSFIDFKARTTGVIWFVIKYGNLNCRNILVQQLNRIPLILKLNINY